MFMINVAIVMGGYSGEHQVSLKSGQLIFDSIDTEKFNPIKVIISVDGWFAKDEEGIYPINKADFSFEKERAKINFDVAFNIIHGTPGEDGYMQAYWDLIGLPYTGCGHYLSALTFNKKDTLAVLNKYNIQSAKSVYLSLEEEYNITEIVEKVGLPCFVKPNQSGSSLGISKVKTKEELVPAFEKAFQEDDDILIESFLDGTEVSVGVIQYKGQTIVPGITEIVSHNEFFDFDAKYNGSSEEITPARIDDETAEKVRNTAIKVYNSLRMNGMSRSEFIIQNGIPYLLEMNTLPGFSPASILPQQLNYAGISIKDFVTSEIEKAISL
ncbi:D-alanine--D-alanine ligase [Flavobacteriaceae bacterium Ap0902]|nr:D-alanine--D-alanine ligase [Flavobacteriaceae bacterium Ap0902]